MTLLFTIEEEEKIHIGFRSRKVRVGDYFEDLRVDERIILKWILQKEHEMPWTGSIWLRIRAIASSCNTVMNLRVPQNAGTFLTS
jgi:hypothetical protein